MNKAQKLTEKKIDPNTLSGQTLAYTGFLTEEEETAYRRGRNAKTHTKAKNTSLATYEMSTGFEAVFGYLDLAGEEGRVKELIAWCIDEVESEGTREYVFN